MRAIAHRIRKLEASSYPNRIRSSQPRRCFDQRVALLRSYEIRGSSFRQSREYGSGFRPDRPLGVQPYIASVQHTPWVNPSRPSDRPNVVPSSTIESENPVADPHSRSDLVTGTNVLHTAAVRQRRPAAPEAQARTLARSASICVST